MTDQQNTQNYGSTQQQPASATTTPTSTIDDSYQHHKYVSYPGYHDEEEEEERIFSALLKEHLLATPFIFCILFSFMLLSYAFQVKFEPVDVNQLKWKEFILGASGWCLAFLIRKPLSIIFHRLERVGASIGPILLLFSIGLIEEVFRLGWLRHIALEYSDESHFLAAYWLGIGWGTAEAICFIVQNFMGVEWYRCKLYNKYTEERQEIEEILGKPLTTISAWWGVMWRTSWTMAHIGFSCWITWNCWLFFPAAIIHGLLDVVWGYCLPVFDIPATSYGTFIITLCTFLVGLALFGQII
ncbi:16393_t:CDS:1 [Acaulospora morrowiae]|uniref:16393_t:CDS:1 n=1 Tax=Acaulospora morrowiae TaxID=94023 RepID=A0A9N8V7X4_9GLOM|nr:16393_t:CDS:1 [Acaulospora morrowiae]